MPKYNGFDNQLRLDGYYLNEIGSKKDAFNIIFIYNNGVVVDLLTVDENELINLNVHLKKYYALKHHENNKLHWGLFEFNGSSISLTNWYPSSGGSLPIYSKTGKVINDSTFNLNSFKSKNGKFIKKINETYHFQQFSPKPDSTNKWIK